MNKFAFMIHAIDVHDVSRKFGFTRYLPDRVVENLLRLAPPIKASTIKGIRSEHAEVEGNFVACTLTSRQMMSLPTDVVINKIIRTGKMAEKMGAQILGLGALTSVVGDAGITVAKNLNIAVTTGNSYTTATAIEGGKKAAEMMGIDLVKAEVVVIGATGSIGAVCARLLAREVKYMTLVARSEEKLEKVAQKILLETGLAVKVTRDVKTALRRADMVITVTSAVDTVIEPEDLKPGAVVVDVARPRDVSRRVMEQRDDVLVIEGGLVEVPGDPDFGLNFGYPPKLCLACMAETMILALEGRMENFTLGRDLTLEQVEEIDRLAKKHGFKLAGFRSFERPVSMETIEATRQRALNKRIALAHA